MADPGLTRTLMPVIVQRDGRLEAVAGTMGGSAQPQILAIALLNAFHVGLDAATATDAWTS